jgi:hypothetical protein
MRWALGWWSVLSIMACQRAEQAPAPPPPVQRPDTTEKTQVPVNATPLEVDPAWFMGDMPDDFEVYARHVCMACMNGWIRLRARGDSDVPGGKRVGRGGCQGVADRADLEELWRNLPAEELAARANGKLGGSCWTEKVMNDLAQDGGATAELHVTARGHTIKIVLLVIPPCDLRLVGPWFKRVFNTRVTVSTCDK